MKTTVFWILFIIFAFMAMPWVGNGIGRYYNWVDSHFKDTKTDSKSGEP